MEREPMNELRRVMPRWLIGFPDKRKSIPNGAPIMAATIAPQISTIPMA